MLGAILTAGAGLLGAIGKSKDKPASEQSGYSQAPQVVKNTMEGPYWTQAIDTFDYLKDRPKARVAPYDDSQLFGSPELSAIQQAADMRAGLIPQQEMVYSNGQYVPLSQPSPLPGAQGTPQAPQQQQGAMPGLAQSYMMSVNSNPLMATNSTRHLNTLAQRPNGMDTINNALGAMPPNQMGDTNALWAEINRQLAGAQ